MPALATDRVATAHGGGQSAHGAVEGRPRRATVGPNAVIQTAAALQAIAGAAARDAIFAAAGCRDLIDAPPQAMIDEAVPARLFAALRNHLPTTEADAVLYDAGRRTADYVIANRIPGFARALLKALPAPLAAPLLLSAIAKNAWTFAGSGTCRVAPGCPHRIEIEANPLATPGCPWHRGVFARMFEVLVDRGAHVSHGACCATGASVCQFQIRTGRNARQT